MKWGKHIPEYDLKKHIELQEEGWTQLKEAKSISGMILMSLPLMIILALASYLLIDLYVGIDLKAYGFDFDKGTYVFNFNIIVCLAMILFLLIHEIIHLIFIPNFIKSKKTIIGLKVFFGFVYSEEKIKKNRYLLISLAPLLFLSILLPIILGMMGMLKGAIVIYIIINSAGSSVDLLNVIMVMLQVPTDCMLTSNGKKTYWKKL